MTDVPRTGLIPRLLVGVCGSVSVYDHLRVLADLRGSMAQEVRVVLTPSAARMVPPNVVAALVRGTVTTGLEQQGDGVFVPHVELPEWADVFVVLPATAAALASAATGDGRGLLSLALLNAKQPVGFVPGMNARMWSAPAVRRNVEQLRQDGHLVLDLHAGTGRTTSLGTGTTADHGLDPLTVRRFFLHLSDARARADGSRDLSEPSGVLAAGVS